MQVHICIFHSRAPHSSPALITVEALSSPSGEDFLTAAHRDMVHSLRYFSQVTQCRGYTQMLQESFVPRTSTQTYQKRDTHLSFPSIPLPVNSYLHRSEALCVCILFIR